MSDIYDQTSQLLAHLGEELRRADRHNTLASVARFELRDTDEQSLIDAGIVLNDELRALYDWELADTTGSLLPDMYLCPYHSLLEDQDLVQDNDAWLVLGMFLMINELVVYHTSSSRLCSQYIQLLHATVVGTVTEVARKSIERLQNGTYVILPTVFGLSISDSAPEEIGREPGFTGHPDPKFERIPMYGDDD